MSLSSVKMVRILILLGLSVAGTPALGQAPRIRGEDILGEGPPTEVRYGSITTASFDKPQQIHVYALRVRNEGDKLNISIKPKGETLRTAFALFDPADVLVNSAPRYPSGSRDASQRIRRFLGSSGGLPMPTISTVPLSAKGTYQIQVTNGGNGGLGTYQLQIEAVLPNGKVIKSGDKDPDEPEAAGDDPKKPAALEEGAIGFKGLPPVDFSTAVTNDLPDDGTIRGKIALDKDKVVRGFVYTTEKGGICEVTLKRTKGAGSLGFVILSSTNEVLAQSTLIAADQLTTTLEFPAGASTLGIYRLDLTKAKAGGPIEFELRVKPASAASRR